MTEANSYNNKENSYNNKENSYNNKENNNKKIITRTPNNCKP